MFFYNSVVPRIFISSSLPMFITLLSNFFYKLLYLYAFVHSYIYFYTACVLSCFSHVRLLVNLWPVACHAVLSVGFSRQEYWSGFPCPSPGDLPNAGIKPTSLMSLALAGGSFTTSLIAKKSEEYKRIYSDLSLPCGCPPSLFHLSSN